MNNNEKLEMLTGKIIYNVIIPVMGLATKDFDILFSGIKDNIKDAYNFGFADGLNTTYYNPYKCGECGGDDLLHDANAEWDTKRRDWVVSWKECSEAYCRDCDQQVTVYQKLFGDFRNENL